MINESLVDEYSCYNFPSTGNGSKYLDHGKISDSKGNSRCKNIDCAVIQKHLEITNFKQSEKIFKTMSKYMNNNDLQFFQKKNKNIEIGTWSEYGENAPESISSYDYIVIRRA